jgi:Right handed beta helix region
VGRPVTTFPSTPSPSTPSPTTPPASGAPASPTSPTVAGSSPPKTDVTCDLFAAPSGSDTTGNGSLSNPYQSVVKLDERLAPGQTGCLRGGTYGSVSTHEELSKSGTTSGQVTIAAYPGETATVVGWVDIEASYTTVSGLQIDGSNTFYHKAAGSPCPSPATVSQALDIAGKGDVFEQNNYYQSVASLRGTAIGVGFWGDADNTVIRYNRIHDVGQCTQHDHLIYLASGNHVQIYDNWMYNDHNGFGVTAYPQPTNAQIFANVIDNAGSGINLGDNGSSTASGNEAWNNVVLNSVKVVGDQGELMPAGLVMCSGLDSSSTGNRVFDNDSLNNPNGMGYVSGSVSSAQLSLSGNVSVEPQFVDAAANDYAVASSSPVASWGLWNGESAS